MRFSNEITVDAPADELFAFVRRAVTRVRAVEAAIAGDMPEEAAPEAAALSLPRVPSGVWWALAGGAAGFGAGFLIGRSQ